MWLFNCHLKCISLSCSLELNISNGWWYMPPEPVPAEPWWDDDPAWSRPDPMTAEELAASLDRLCELDEPPEEEECADFEPFTGEEVAEIQEAAADELLAVEAAMTGRRGPGQPGGRVRPRDGPGPGARRRGPGGRRRRRW